jgi:hypothetical protein
MQPTYQHINLNLITKRSTQLTSLTWLYPQAPLPPLHRLLLRHLHWAAGEAAQPRLCRGHPHGRRGDVAVGDAGGQRRGSFPRSGEAGDPEEDDVVLQQQPAADQDQGEGRWPGKGEEHLLQALQ